MAAHSFLNLFAGEAAEQFRLIRCQLYNWGTFSGLQDIEISPEGHLFIGGSGSGKSTLLDAMSVLLTPPRDIDFNAAAAREGGRKADRTILSYVRGAWTTKQDDEGRSVTQYLRKQSTWSAVALTFKNDFRVVTLLFVAIIRGSTNEDSRVTRYYYVVPENFDIKRLEPFAEHDYDWRFIRKEIPQAKSFARFAPYCEHFRAIFGIESDTVLKLLHKAQSARNLGDLNQFLRKFMLDEPETFGRAETLVSVFSELYAAHESVIKAREQIAVLSDAQTHYQRVQQALDERRQNEAMISSLDGWRAAQMVELIEDELPRALKKEAKAQQNYEDLRKQSEAIEARIGELTREYYEKGGERVVRLQGDLEREEKSLAQAQALHDKYSRLTEQLKLQIPTTRQEFADVKISLNDRLESTVEELNKIRAGRDELIGSRHEAEQKFRQLREEIAAMEKSPTNIPARQVQLRDRLAGELGLAPEKLPFVGELLQVKESEDLWKGAIERVLHNFALSVLVDDENYKRFASLVNRLNLHGRLVYHRVQEIKDTLPSVSSRSIACKLDIKDCFWRPWITRELASRFDYECVESVSEFQDYERAVTMTGQIKHSLTRHEKDDRYNITDRSRWVLGFSNEEKLALYKEQAADLGQKIAGIQSSISAKDAMEARVHEFIKLAQRALEYEWEQIDIGTLTANAARIKNELQALLQNDHDLNRIEKEKEAKKLERNKVNIQKESAFSQWQEAEKRVEALEVDLENYQKELKAASVDPAVLARITNKTLELKLAVSLQSMSRTRERLASQLAQISEALAETITAETGQTVSFFSMFKQRWPDAALQLDIRIESAPEFFEKLETLQKEGLPKFEANFRDMLNNQARQNLVDLYQEIDNERRTIKQRLQEVNKSLARVVFNRKDGVASYLRIAVTDRNPAEVLEFKRMQREIMSREVDAKDMLAAEHYFKLINDLVQKLNPNSADPAVLRWRDKVLDVRQHVEFKGVEFKRDDDGQEEIVEIYPAETGKSGGERQKLTVICLAAALRYQLGGKESDYPRYAPVILDEAFDKADSEFTDIALTVFKDFHFQLIIATPEKSVMTLDPYVGGTTYVSCRNRCSSSVLSVVYDSKTGEIKPRENKAGEQ